MARLLWQNGAARHVGMGVRLFRQLCREGKGPKVFNPHGGRPRYVDTELDRWIESRDDRPARKVAA